MSSVFFDPLNPNTPSLGQSELPFSAGLPSTDSAAIPNIDSPQKLALSTGLAVDAAIAQFTATTDSNPLEIAPSVLQFPSQDPSIASLSAPQLGSGNQADALTGIASTQSLVLTLNQVLDISETFQDQLDTTDSFNPTRFGSYKDDYLLTAPSSGELYLDLSSCDFDAYLQIIDANTGEVLLENDDFGYGTDAYLSFDVQAGSSFIVRATSFTAYETGSYDLTAYLATDDNPDPKPPTQFDTTYGYGLVDAAAAVAKALGQQPFEDVADIGGLEWNNDLINAPEVWAQGYTGKGITVAVIDSGVDINHEDLTDNIWTNTGELAGDGLDNDGNGYIDDVYGWNFGVGQNNNDVTPGTNTSGQTHGTHVAGTIAAKNNGIGMTGVAPDAKIMAIRMGDVDETGSFTNAGDLAKAIRYAVDNGAHAINMSLGWSDSPGLAEALAYAASKNVITISAAGNNSLAEPGTPAQYAIDYGLSVGAVDSNKIIADFSNRAGSDDRMQHVVAPGVEIYSTLPGNSYGFKQGTSMAAPHVAGVVALMLSANLKLTHTQVREILTTTSGGLTNQPQAPLDFSSLSVGEDSAMPSSGAGDSAADSSPQPQWDGELTLPTFAARAQTSASAYSPAEAADGSQLVFQGYQVQPLVNAQFSFQSTVDLLEASAGSNSDSDLVFASQWQGWSARPFTEPTLA